MRRWAFAALFACTQLSGCLSMALWSDHRTRTRTVTAESPELRAWLCADPPSLLLQLPPHAREHLAAAAPSLGTPSEWLRLQPTQDEGEPPWQHRGHFEVWMQRDERTGEASWQLGTFPFPLLKLEMRRIAPPTLACRAAWLTGGPTAPAGEPVEATLADYVVADDDTSLLVRLAVTPLAVCGDVVLITATAVILVPALVIGAPIGLVASAVE